LTVAALFNSGQVVDLILALVFVEALVLFTFRYLTGRGVALRSLVPNLLAGVFLLLALRSALLEAPWSSTAVWLAAALVAHVADLATRWRR